MSETHASRENIEQAVRKIIGEILEIDPNEIDADAKLIEDLGMDSMMALEILAVIEKQFRIKIPEQSLSKMTSLTKIIQIAQEHANKP